MDRASGLAAVHHGIAASHPSVAHINANDFSSLSEPAMVVFDTREPEEFAVSHIAGAIRVAPDLPPEAFLNEFGHLVEGKTAVFYCSVGARSSQYAEQVQEALRDSGAINVVNLERGLFGWHNDDRPLVQNSGAATRLIHPYDENWGRLVDRTEFLSYAPEIF